MADPTTRPRATNTALTVTEPTTLTVNRGNERLLRPPPRCRASSRTPHRHTRSWVEPLTFTLDNNPAETCTPGPTDRHGHGVVLHHAGEPAATYTLYGSFGGDLRPCLSPAPAHRLERFGAPSSSRRRRRRSPTTGRDTAPERAAAHRLGRPHHRRRRQPVVGRTRDLHPRAAGRRHRPAPPSRPTNSTGRCRAPSTTGTQGPTRCRSRSPSPADGYYQPADARNHGNLGPEQTGPP